VCVLVKISVHFLGFIRTFNFIYIIATPRQTLSVEEKFAIISRVECGVIVRTVLPVNREHLVAQYREF